MVINVPFEPIHKNCPAVFFLDGETVRVTSVCPSCYDIIVLENPKLFPKDFDRVFNKVVES